VLFFIHLESRKVDIAVVDWVESFSARWQMWPGRTPSWPGTARTSPARDVSQHARKIHEPPSPFASRSATGDTWAEFIRAHLAVLGR